MARGYEELRKNTAASQVVKTEDYNQVEQLQKENEYLRNKSKELETEALALYRRIHATDVPEGRY